MIAIYVINLGYGFEGSLTRLGEFRFVSRSLTGVAEGNAPRVAANRFKDSWLGALPVPYLVLTGENNPAEQSRWKALAHKVVDTTLDQIFGEENDAVIGISSLRAVGVKDDPNLSLPDPFACNHSAYFTLPEVTERVRAFL